MSRLKRILVIQPLACMGRCSLTVSLPVLSAGALETVPLPTAMLSTHTGKSFTPPVKAELGSAMWDTAQHLKANGAAFQAILTGHLYSAEQIGPVCRIADMFKGGRTLTFVDPAFGDGGRLYSGFGSEYPKAMAEMVSRADYLLPNITEAAMLTGLEYPGESPGKDFFTCAVERLRAMGARNVLITGAVDGTAGYGYVYVYEAKRQREVEVRYHRVPGAFHGAGDFFTAAFAAQVLNGIPTLGATERAARLTARCIAETAAQKTEERDGLIFEPFLDQIRPKRFEKANGK